MPFQVIVNPVEHKGGAGSGHHGHSGRPGKRGGSSPGGGLSTVQTSALNRLSKMKEDKKYRGDSSSDDPVKTMFPTGRHGLTMFMSDTSVTSTVPVSLIVGSVGNIHRPGVENYIRNPDRITDKPIIVMRHEGKYIIADGHHRATALILMGHTSIKVEVSEYDEDYDPYGY